MCDFHEIINWFAVPQFSLTTLAAKLNNFKESQKRLYND